MKLLLKQSLILPLTAMLVPIFMAFGVSGYSSISQQISELELLNRSVAPVTRISAMVSGASIILFGLSLLRRSFPRYAFTGFASLVFGISMICNGVFVMGSPLHGLYGIGICIVLVPAFFAAEFGYSAKFPAVRKMSMLVAVCNLVYMWMIFVRFDPAGFHGLTQRASIIVMFGWFSAASYVLLCSGVAEKAEEG